MIKITLEDPEDYLIYRDGSGGTIEIYDIVVNSERGVGKGRRLIGLLLETLASSGKQTHLIFAITRKSNMIAREFYIHTGFKLMSYLTNFYPEEYNTANSDAVMYGLRPKK